jgi:protein arginine N-methyltransferase 1
MANQADAAKTDPLSGMAHSEAHYFNRYDTQDEGPI